MGKEEVKERRIKRSQSKHETKEEGNGKGKTGKRGGKQAREGRRPVT